MIEMMAGEVKIQYNSKIKRKDLTKITSPKSVEKHIRPYFEEVINFKERMVAMFLNRNNSILGIAIISDGAISGTICDQRIVFQHALLLNATTFIMCHNHPSGNLTPSEEDIKLTKKLEEAGKILDIQLLDSLILTEDEIYSIKEHINKLT